MPDPAALRIVEVPHARVPVATRIAVERTLPFAAKELKLDAPAVRYFRHAIASDTNVRSVDARWQRSGTIVAGFADRLLHEIWVDATQTPAAVVDRRPRARAPGAGRAGIRRPPAVRRPGERS